MKKLQLNINFEEFKPRSAGYLKWSDLNINQKINVKEQNFKVFLTLKYIKQSFKNLKFKIENNQIKAK